MTTRPHPASTSAGASASPERDVSAIAPQVRLERELLERRELALAREWIETDGRGGFAMGTALQCATRRFHGLLCCVPDGHSEPHLLLARFDEALCGEGRRFPLGLARYGERFAPEQPLALERFELVPYPRWTYRFGLVELRRELLMPAGQRTVLVRWSLTGPRSGLQLNLKPQLPFRRADALTGENLELDGSTQRSAGTLQFTPYPGLPTLTIGAAAGETAVDLEPLFEADPVWYREIAYVADQALGEGGPEAQFSPGWMNLPLEPGEPLVLACSIEGAVEDPAALWAAEAERREAQLQPARRGGSRRLLEHAAEQFIRVDSAGGEAVTAGLPWLGERIRDTYLALPGLTLARGAVGRCGAVLERTLGLLRGGLLTNSAAHAEGGAERGAADAALWFALAVERYAATPGADRELVALGLRRGLVQIAEACLDGAERALRVDDAGLLSAGTPDVAPSWMDARSDGRTVTPRAPFAVELNALWFALLDHLVELAADAGDDAEQRRWAVHRDRAGAAFLERFWCEGRRMLLDAWAPDGEDDTLRCNALIAAALPRSPLSIEQRRAVVERTERELLTPRGVRTLAPKNPAYEGHLRGGPAERQRGLHQGAAWVWPLGYYVEAALHCDPARAGELRELLRGFDEHLLEAGLGHVSELFDGDPPHRPGGAPAAAAGTAELLRAHALLDAAEAACDARAEPSGGLR